MCTDEPAKDLRGRGDGEHRLHPLLCSGMYSVMCLGNMATHHDLSVRGRQQHFAWSLALHSLAPHLELDAISSLVGCRHGHLNQENLAATVLKQDGHKVGLPLHLRAHAISLQAKA